MNVNQISSSINFQIPSVVSTQLDTLSKEDLIKFAKKQMGAMVKLKSKCAGKFTQVLKVFGFPDSF